MIQQSGTHEILHPLLCHARTCHHLPEALVESFKFLKEQIDQEKRALAKHWAAREKQLEAMVGHTAGLYGSIQGIVGQNTLPEIKVLQLEPSFEETTE